ncbi:hypothetical protein [Luteibacter yeojuensis]|uniref:Alpha-tubulin suppressor-like RCC1 family protein n=1 Tax=Luteibacter yeojuensis TaxID=345309 RepID=A0A7X5TPJ4_9GAMM|nr:hypothetical protein [Luteibacter yeojuensis]NID14537.1 hypothetical protein [Luteibacter yeojuensis]
MDESSIGINEGEEETPGTTAPWTFVDKYQDVPAEESTNSYIKQFGRFAVYDDDHGPVDRQWGSTGRAYAFSKGKDHFAAGGSATHGANVPAPIPNYLRRNPAQRIFSTSNTFAVLVPVGNSNRLILWGPGFIPANNRYPLRGIRSVYANGTCFAFIYEAPLPSGARAGQRIGATGADANGGLIPDAVHLKLADDPPVSIRATAAAFAVLTESGKVHTWGNAAFGGTMSTSATSALAGERVRKLFANYHAFCAIRDSDGAPVAWGNAANGGDIPADVLNNITSDGGAETVVAANTAFCCITAGRRKAFAWGLAAQGGSMTTEAVKQMAVTGNIAACRAGSWAFCMINTRGQVGAWGNTAHGGTTTVANIGNSTEPVTGIQSADATPADEVVQEFVDDVSSSSEPVAAAAGPIGWSYAGPDWKAYIYAVDSGFCLITTYPDDLIRSVSSWGAANTVISDPAKQVMLASYFEAVKTSNRAYLAIVRQGDAGGCPVAWGEATANGGAVPADIEERLQGPIVDARANTVAVPLNAVANTSGFTVWTASGQMATWGGGTGMAFIDT